jgi:hypothetical protein
VISVDEIRHLFRCDAEAGILYWTENCPGSAHRGKRAGHVEKPGDGYVRVYSRGVRYQAHRLIWVLVHGSHPKYFIDHINGNKSDNRISNLRDVPHSVNCQNRRLQRSGQLVGTSPIKGSSRWIAHAPQVFLNRKSTMQKYLGVYPSMDGAHQAVVDYCSQENPL